MTCILVTGAAGFVGSALSLALVAQGHAVRAAVRSPNSKPSVDGPDMVVVGEVGAQTDWEIALKGVDCVIHCAARAHVMEETGAHAQAFYRAVNVAGTQRLAEQASELGVRRLVFLSSIKVNGESTEGSIGFAPDDAPRPEDAYGLSKWEAEQALWAVSASTGLEVVVVRPPVVYGPGVKGNLLRLLSSLARGWPLPLGAVHNQRSMVGLHNLVDLLCRCAVHPAAAGQTLLASDGQDLSTPQLIRLLAEGVNKRAYLPPVPVGVLRAAGLLLGKGSEVDRLVGSLQVDSRHTRKLLDWTPSLSVQDGLRDTGRWYAKSQSGRL